MNKRRQERMAVEIKRVLAQIIKDQVKDPRIDFSTLSITSVDVPNDVSHARIFISVLGDENRQNQTMKALEAARGFIRKELAQQIQVKHAPEIEFRLDKSIEHGIRISALLNEIKEGEEKNETTGE
ncbi:MAG: 30S ribosome-binding factor RbfA [Syntrophomonadaceae bacterium]